jgi:glutamate/aspartate transport system substrate-binding protein
VLLAVGWRGAFAVLAFSLSIELPIAAAEEQQGSTLDRFRQTGVIRVGHWGVAIPFSYYDAEHRPVGYSVDICMRIVDAIRAQFGLPELEIEFTEVTAATRIPMLANGTVDIECGPTTNTPTRQQQGVSFATTTFVGATRLATKMDANIKSLSDLAGKRLVAVAGTDNILRLTELNGRQQLGIIIVPVKDLSVAFHMLEESRVEAVAADDILAYSMVATSNSPRSYVMSDQAFSVEPLAIMFRKEDSDIKSVANGVIAKLFQAGEINKLYDKWFMSAIPPKNVNLNVPMSDALKRVIAKPTDSPNPNDYQP